MAGVYCPRCETTVLIESDGQSCSNCGGQLIGAAKPPTLESTAPKTTTRGRATAAREAHNLEIVGSNPAPASLTIPELNAAAAAAAAKEQAKTKAPTVHTNGRHPSAPTKRTAPARKPTSKTPASAPKSVSKSKTPTKR